jgi:uncharacterized protein
MSTQDNDSGQQSEEAVPAAPKIEFPCPYPIKVMGLSSDFFVAEVVRVCRCHAPETADEKVSVRPSSQGNYTAVTVVIEASGIAQLESLFADLKTIDGIKMVL